MIGADLNLGNAPAVLVLGAHCDDIEIGCGGTLSTLGSRYPNATLVLVVFSGSADRRKESEDCFRRLLPASTHEVVFHEFRDGFFPASWPEIKETFEALKARCKPDVILTHRCEDAHQDHRTIGELTWNTFRDHLILEYEIPKYDGDLGQPNLFVTLSETILEQKIEALLQSHHSQKSRAWFDRGTFEAIARLRGVECVAPSGYAEGFHVRKLRAFDRQDD